MLIQFLTNAYTQIAVTLLLCAWMLMMYVIVSTRTFLTAFFFKFLPLVLVITQIAILIVGQM